MVAGALLGALPAIPASAQPVSPAPRLTVLELSGWLQPGDDLRIRLRVDNPAAEPVAGLQLVATVERPTVGRAELAAALVGGVPDRGRLARVREEIDQLAGGGAVTVDLRASADQLGLPPEPGVLPLNLQLLVSGEPAATLRTAVVTLPEQVARPLRLALLLPIDAPPSVLPDGSLDRDPLGGQLQDDGPLPRLLDSLAGAPDLPVTLALNGLVTSELAGASDGYVATDAAGTVEVEAGSPAARRAERVLGDLQRVLDRASADAIALPYADADLVALVRHGQGGTAQRSVGQGVRLVQESTGERPAPGVLLPPAGLDDATLDAVAAAGVDSVVLSADGVSTAASPGATSTGAVHRLQAVSGAMTALVPDDGMTDLLRRFASAVESGPVLGAQRVLAETAALHLEAPQQPRGVLLAPPERWDPDGAELHVLLRQLARAPWLAPVTLPQLAAEVPPAPETARLSYSMAAERRELDAGYLAEVRAARDAVGVLGRILVERPGSVRPERLQRLALMAASVAYRPSARRPAGLALARAAEDGANEVLDGVQVVPGPQVRLTSTTGTVPVPVRNDAAVPVRVRVRLSSSQFALPEGGMSAEELELAPGAEVLVAFTVEARNPGGIGSLQVEIVDPSGLAVLATGTVVVRSTAYSVAALGVTGAAGVFLAVWWVRDARKRRAATPGRVDSPATGI